MHSAWDNIGLVGNMMTITNSSEKCAANWGMYIVCVGQTATASEGFFVFILFIIKESFHVIKGNGFFFHIIKI